ncbi:MAG: class I tRNA ligase family protein [Gemmataceae bacterium]|nr:class I tRNA ligase family protein [Gemmataceae bacterium]
MPFDKVDPQVDFPAQERAILEFWQRVGAFEALRAKNRGKPKWSFLDGPITANNPMGVHHAWGRTYKDTYQRFFAMTGHELRYQNGFDCQGLWVEVEVEKELGLRSKRDIEELVPGDRFASIDKFVTLCKERVNKFARIQTEQSIRLGYWMDWDRDEDWLKPPDQRRSYYTMSEENNYTIWSFLKRCHQRGLIYRAYDCMPWCPRCAVGLSEMEVKEGYKRVAHKSVFVKFPLRNRPREHLLVWTTTPWTLTSNVAAAVNPELTYLRVLHQGEIYYVGKTAFAAPRAEEPAPEEDVDVEVEVASPRRTSQPRLKSIEQLFKEKGKEGYHIVGELAGAEMVGWEYDGPFDELPAQAEPSGFPQAIAEVVRRQGWAPPVSARAAHRVVAWKEVGATTGTGIVHIAPGCGKEDFHLGKDQGLPPLAPLDEAGAFVAGFGWLTGLSAVEPSTADRILDDLRQKGRLFAAELYPHSYPHCWRCKTELLFRLVDEWFIDMRWRGEIMEVTRQVTFLPEAINGKTRELKWLEQMGDWMISKKRFWGLALPIWVDEQTGEFEVIGSREELRQRAVEGWAEFEGHTPHRPWIDRVKIRNPKTGHLMTRIPDVGNPWLDAGIVPFSTLRYNHDRAYWEKWVPAEFITESFPGQFRNWFYAILAMSTMMVNRPPFKVLLGHALVRDEHGNTMSKSLGNAIEFNEAADKMGADVMRWLYCRSNPALNINFGYGPADELRSKFVIKLWNTYAFFCNYARLDGFDPAAPPVPIRERPDIDRWILSDLQLLIQTAHREFRRYNVQAFCLEAEKFVDDKLSNWYVRRNRRRFWKSEQGTDKQAAYQTLYTVLMTLSRLFAPVMPFVTEAMYQNLRAGNPKENVSVHLCDYPQADEALIDRELSADMEAVLQVVSLGSAARNSVKIKVRQPLAELVVQGPPRVRSAVERFADQIAEELNIKRVRLHDAAGALLQPDIKPNLKALGPKHGNRLHEVRAAIEEYVRSGRGVPEKLECPGGAVVLEPGDLVVEKKAPPGWAGAADKEIEVLIDARITPELKREGLAREVIRQVQQARKNAGLEMEDRIELHLGPEAAELRQAIEAHRDYIATETLTSIWKGTPLAGEAYRERVQVDGHALPIELRKVPTPTA